MIRVKGGPPEHLKVRSFVGLIPLFAALAIEPGTLEHLPHFRRRVEWYLRYRSTLAGNLWLMTEPGDGGRRLLALADRDKLEAIVPRLLDPSQFLSDFGLRSMSRGWLDEPYRLRRRSRVAYEPGESASPIYGGNSNWRGPIWFPVNYLMIEALREFHRYYGSSLTVELPRWSRSTGDARRGRRRDRRSAGADLSPRLRRPPPGPGRRPRYSSPIRTGATSSRFMSISTATTARAWAPATRPAGRPWSPS